MFKNYILLFLFFGSLHVFSQTGSVKGVVKDAVTGVEIDNANVLIRSLGAGTNSNTEGLYTLSKLTPGKYKIEASNIGYDTLNYYITIVDNKTITQNFYLKPIVFTIGSGKIVEVGKNKKKEDVDIGTTKITAKQLTKIPTIGGTPDLVQYLQILPGVVFSGDQGGQLYIRGGSPIMNKILLDGMTIYNPFHSIGLFSIFDADLIKSADVYSAGFGVEYGGRISAIVDVKTRDGDRNKLSGNVAVSPFLGKISLEGPLKKFVPGKGSSSFIVSVKNSYLDKSAHIFYNYADPGRLPYSFNDIYGKMSFNSSNGSNIRVFGFNFKDNVNFPGSTSYGWNQFGFGTRFTMVPEGRQTKVDGFLTYSNYLIEQREKDNKPRSSGINGFNVGLAATTYNVKDEIKYGFEINGFRTQFNIYNTNNRLIQQDQFTTELCGYGLYKVVRDRYVFEAGIRTQFYASLGNTSLEPRINGKYNISKRLTFKAAAGKYSQNLMSASSDKDVVNLFYGFLSGSDDLPKNFNGKPVTSRLQLAWHGVAGLEYDINRFSDVSIEGFYKNFNQITNINRDKLFDDVPEYSNQPEKLRKSFIVENGSASGADFRYKFVNKRIYAWAVYSLTYVKRYDGEISYRPSWDRRHNINLVFDYVLDKKGKLSANARWNFGSGFPFTQTQGFYEKIDFQSGPSANYTNSNGSLGIVYAGFNQGRLPTYHRLDASVKYTFKASKKVKTWMVLSVTNVYNRSNIFYFDRVNFTRVNQLPILPSVSFNASF